ncbi:recombinase family protein, partial [Streptomyces flaveolus]
SLTESFDTKTPLGRGVLGLFAAVAEDELHRLKARTREGMKAAKRRGKHVGRPPTLTPEKLDLAHRLLADGKGRAATARAIGVDPATLRRHLNQENGAPASVRLAKRQGINASGDIRGQMR